MTEPENRFDATRAELFEALGHPMRVKILQALESRPMGFAELKKEVGIESSGHLEFHLRKLSGLVGTNSEGSYALTDDGKEAIRVLNLTSGREGIGARVRSSSRGRGNHTRLFVAVLLVLLIILAGVAAYQQQQIAALGQSASTGTVTIGQTKYYYEDISPYAPNGTIVRFHGVTFVYLTAPPGVAYSNPANYTAKGLVRLSNGTSLNLTGKIVGVGIDFNLLNECWASMPMANLSAPGQGIVYYTTLPLIPTIAITFADRSHEIFDAPNVTARYEGTEIWLTYAWKGNIANPWFGQHMNPQAGIFFDCMSPQRGLTVYVSE
jgi:ArsR family transcriptional regulator